MCKLLCFLLLIEFNIVYSQWQPDIRLTNNSGSSITNTGKCIASENNYLHIVWLDNRDGNFEIYYKHSTNAGLNWTSDTRLTNNAGYSYAPSVSVEGVNVYVTFSDDRTGNYEVYFMRSTNKGLTWSSETRISANDSYHSYESNIYSDGNVYAAWLEDRLGDLDIYFTRSTNNGSSWSSPLKLTANSYAQKYPVISASGSTLHVVYEDERAGISNTEIYYMRSTNSGLNWQSEINISEHSGQSWNGYIYSAGASVHIVWDDDWSGNREIYYRRSTNSGLNWSGNAIITVSPGISAGPSISVSGVNAHLVWSDERDGNREIYYKLSTNNGSSWSNDLRLTSNSGNSGASSVCISGNSVNVLWYDDRNGNNEVYYKRNPTGNPTSVINISSDIPDEFSLSQNYPNPFNPSTNIEFNIPFLSKTPSGRGVSEGRGVFVNLTIYDASGRIVEVLHNGKLDPGTYKAEWNASKYSSGIYFYKLLTIDYTLTRKMVLVK